MSNHLELSFFNDTSSSTRESVNDNLPFIFEDLDFSNEKSEKSESNQSYESFDNFLEIETK